MKKHIRFTLLFFISAIFLFSCKKGEQINKENNSGSSGANQTSTVNGTSGISNFFAQNGASTQNLTISTDGGNKIKCDKGMSLTIPAYSFFDSNNNYVIGEVNIEIKEIYSKKDMILTGMFSTTMDVPLVSGGEIFIRATQNGQELKLANNAQVEVKIPVGESPSNKMMEFYAPTLNAESVSSWVLSNTADTIEIQDSINIEYYTFIVDSLRWINVDYFMDFPMGASDISVAVPSPFDQSNCMVFVSFNGVNSASKLNFVNGKFNSTIQWPIGFQVT